MKPGTGLRGNSPQPTTNAQHQIMVANPWEARCFWLFPDFSPSQSIIGYPKIRLVESAVVWRIASDVHRATFALPAAHAEESTVRRWLCAARGPGHRLGGRPVVVDQFTRLGHVPLTAKPLRNRPAFAEHRFHGLIHEHVRQMFGDAIQFRARLFELCQVA